jgi:hypothetical protein
MGEEATSFRFRQLLQKHKLAPRNMTFVNDLQRGKVLMLRAKHRCGLYLA